MKWRWSWRWSGWNARKSWIPQTDPSITVKPRFPKKLDGVSKPFKHSSKGFPKTQTKRNMGNLLRPVHGPVTTGFSGDQKEIATLRVSSTDCPILSDILDLPKHLQGHIQLWLHMARSLWLKDSNYTRLMARLMALWPCQLALVLWCSLWNLRDLQRFCSCHAHRRSFLLSTAPSPRSTLGSQHSNTQNLQCLWIDMNDPVQYLSKQLAESMSHPGTQTNVLHHYYWGTTVKT